MCIRDSVCTETHIGWIGHRSDHGHRAIGELQRNGHTVLTEGAVLGGRTAARPSGLLAVDPQLHGVGNRAAHRRFHSPVPRGVEFDAPVGVVANPTLIDPRAGQIGDGPDAEYLTMIHRRPSLRHSTSTGAVATPSLCPAGRSK